MMLDSEKIQHDFNKSSAFYTENSLLQKSIAIDLINLAAPYTTKDSKILDLGCGSGQIAALLAKQEITNITMVDNASKMLDIARENFPKYNIIEDDINCLTKLNQLYDVIFANMSLHWCAEINTAIKNAKKHLKPNGKIFISIPSENSFQELHEINQKLKSKLKLGPLINPENLKNQQTQTKKYSQSFASLLELLKNFKKTGTGSKSSENKAILKSDYNYLKSVNEKYKTLSWEIIFIT
jgi:ubiquinone/menaquinone biosynthesis C-methylase UbiE